MASQTPQKASTQISLMRPGGGVERHHRLEIVAGAVRRGLGSEFLQHMFHEHRHVKEADRSGEVGVERGLLRRVEDRTGEPAQRQHLAREAAAPESAPDPRAAKSSRPIGGEVEPLHRQRPPLRPVEREADGAAHVRGPELGDDRPVAEPHHGMHDRLRMHQHLDPLGVNVEERLRLDHLQRLVEHGGAVDGDPLAHVPVRDAPWPRPASRSPCAPSASRGTARPRRSG